jgi:hypothetical protein
LRPGPEPLSAIAATRHMSSPSGSKSQRAAGRRLLEIFEALPEAERKTVQDLAEFLHARTEPQPRELASPEPIPRPRVETVVKAVKRLSATYPMIDKSEMLNETSALMSQHIMQGRAAADVIDELERLFRTHYERMLQDKR